MMLFKQLFSAGKLWWFLSEKKKKNSGDISSIILPDSLSEAYVALQVITYFHAKNCSCLRTELPKGTS